MFCFALCSFLSLGRHDSNLALDRGIVSSLLLFFDICFVLDHINVVCLVPELLLHHRYDLVSLIYTTAGQRLSPALPLLSIYCIYGPLLWGVVQFIQLSHFRSPRDQLPVVIWWGLGGYLGLQLVRRANITSLVPLWFKSHSFYICDFSYICIAFYCQQNTFTFCNLCTRQSTK